MSVTTTKMHDSKGKFAVGNPGGPGRPGRGIEQQYLDVFFAIVTPQRWGEVVTVALEDATNGSVTARRHGREWLSRIIVPALERIIIASLNVNMDVQLDEQQVGELIGMLVGGQDASAIGDVIEGQVVENE